MRTHTLLRIGIGVFFTICAMAVNAAEVTVAPGTGTLATAVASASNGDTLILQDGSYYGDVTIDKTLVVRAQTMATNAIVVGLFKVQGAEIEVTVQGLTFTQTSEVWQADAVRLLQNHWVDGSITVTNYKTTEGDGELFIIGNTLDNGYISTVFSENAYIAGNILTGRIITNVSGWIVGNDIVKLNNSMAAAIIADGVGTNARIIGNRVMCGSLGGDCIRTAGSTISIIQNNIVELAIASSQTSTSIEASGSNATITNNIIIFINGTTQSYHGGLSCGNSGIVSGNIIVGHGVPIESCLQPAVPISNNLCFNNNGIACPSGNGNLNSDPQFVDQTDYRLSPTSPAIDAGSSDFELADLDRSRNDIGAYGGPWSIDQYDIQRDPSNYTPYVYPLFPGGAAFSGGTLNAQAIGVAKLR